MKRFLILTDTEEHYSVTYLTSNTWGLHTCIHHVMFTSGSMLCFLPPSSCAMLQTLRFFSCGFFKWGLYSFLLLLLQQNTWPKPLTDGRIYFGSQIKDTVHLLAWNSWATGTCSGWLHCIHHQEAESEESWYLDLPFLFRWGPQPMK